MTSEHTGVKFDAGKPLAGRVLGGFARALLAVAESGTYGARKYNDTACTNWFQVPDAQNRYTDALLRHLLLEKVGEETDPESGLLHATHAAWNALARLELILREREQS